MNTRSVCDVHACLYEHVYINSLSSNKVSNASSNTVNFLISKEHIAQFATMVKSFLLLPGLGRLSFGIERESKQKPAFTISDF